MNLISWVYSLLYDKAARGFPNTKEKLEVVCGAKLDGFRHEAPNLWLRSQLFAFYSVSYSVTFQLQTSVTVATVFGMPSRRSHTKSHHGCRQCKARRVKVSFDPQLTS